MKKDTYLAYGETEDASAYLAEDKTYVDTYKREVPRWAMVLSAAIVVLIGVVAAILVMGPEWSHNVDRYNKGAESTLKQDENAEQEQITKLNQELSILKAKSRSKTTEHKKSNSSKKQ